MKTLGNKGSKYLSLYTYIYINRIFIDLLIVSFISFLQMFLKLLNSPFTYLKKKVFATTQYPLAYIRILNQPSALLIIGYDI